MDYKIIHQFPKNGGGASLLSSLEASTREVLQVANLREDHVLFRAVVGHASVGGIALVRERIMLPLLSARNLTVQWVVGVDFNSRPADTFRALDALVREFGERLGERLGIFLFSSNGQGKSSIMHTKMYWIGTFREKGGKHTDVLDYVFVGSSNLSVGGLEENRELGVRIKLGDSDQKERIAFQKIWDEYERSKKCHALDERDFRAKFERRRGEEHMDWRRDHPKHRHPWAAKV